jgi:O-antigen/teichoic acid export membrane protein
MSKGRATRNFISYFLYNGARYIFPLVLTPFLARMLKTDAYGDLILWNSCVWTASMVMEFGFYIYGVNRVALTQSQPELAKAASSIVSAKLLLAPLAIAGYAIATVYVGLAAREPLPTLFGFIAMIAYGSSFAWLLQGLERGGLAVSVEAAPQVIQFALTVLLVRGPSDLWVATLLQALCALLVASSGFYLARRLDIRFSLRMTAAIEAIRQAFPYFIERLCFTAYSTATPILIAAFSSQAQVAWYGIGDKVNTFLVSACIPLTQTALPIVTRRVAVGRSDWSLSLKLLAGATTFTLLLAVISYMTLDYVIRTLFSPMYAAAIPVAQLFCLTAVFMSAQSSIANFIIVPGGRASVLIRSSVGALVVGVGLQMLLVPRLGAIGAVLARTIAEFCVLSILAYASMNILRSKSAAIGSLTRGAL